MLMENTTDFSRATDLARERVQNEFGTLPYNCVLLDKDIKRISDKLANERKRDLFPNIQQKAYLDALEATKYNWEAMWATKGCRDIIENIRETTAAVNVSKYAIKAEKQVLPKNEKDQNIYIGLGGVVMLIGLYIVLKK